ncbi:MAG: HAMP domain-containing histidine kinase [Cellulosilyticum sp.]|nr:HAMP domain-containing histidine kinase [Cellulosilyticum sp.]
MGEKEKTIMLKYVGMIGIVFLVLLDYIGVETLQLNFFIVVIAFAISVATKLFINQYTGHQQYMLIHLLATNQVVKLMIMVFYFCFEANHAYWRFDAIVEARFIVQFIMIQWGEVLILINALKTTQMDKRKILLAQLLVIVGILICEIVSLTYINWIYKLVNMINLVMYGWAYYKCKDWHKESLGNDVIYCKLFAFWSMIQCLIGVIIYDFYQSYALSFSVLIGIQEICLLMYAYKSCLWEPWHKKLDALNETESLIDKQSKACDMIVSLSHELKTPANVIRSAVEIMVLDYKENEDILEEINEIRKDCIQMTNIIQDMIDLQKIKGNHIQAHYQIYNLVEVIEHVIDAFSNQMEQSPFLFNPQEEEIYQKIDLGLLQKFLMLGFNLLIKQNQKSELYIEVGKLKDTQETYILIKHSALQKLKEAYYPISEKLKEGNHIATGLTIQLMQLILQLHQAKMQCNNDGEGVTMKIIFPECTSITDEWIDEENIDALGEQIRARDMLVNL